MSSQLLSLLKDQFACCVKLLKLISDDDRLEAVKHMETVLAEFRKSSKGKDEPDEQNHHDENLNTEEYTERDIKQEEEDDDIQIAIDKPLVNDNEFNQEKVITANISIKDETMKEDIKEYTNDETVINVQCHKPTFKRIIFESSSSGHSNKTRKKEITNESAVDIKTGFYCKLCNKSFTKQGPYMKHKKRDH